MTSPAASRSGGIGLRRVPGFRWAWLALGLPPFKRIRKLAAEGDVPSLIAHLTTVVDRSAEAQFRRAAAATALGRLGAAEAIDALAKAMRLDDAPCVRACAADALTRIGGPHAVRELTAFVSDDVFKVRQAAIKAIANSGDDALVPYLLAALADATHWSIKAQAVEGLGKLGTIEAVSALEGCVMRDGALTAVDATYALSHATTSDAEAVLVRLTRSAPSAFRRFNARRGLRRIRRYLATGNAPQ